MSSGKKSAHTIEVDPKTPHDVITIMEQQRQYIAEERYGGSMRLGAYTAHIEKGTLLHNLYGAEKVDERHRHRYEVNDAYVETLEEHGLRISARSKTGLVEAVETTEKNPPILCRRAVPPEFTARPFSPNPLFTGLIKAAKKRREI